MPLLSIIVTIYNKEKYLSNCLTSILQQTFKDFELILIDDGSTDGSIDIARKFAREDNRIHIFHQENMGLASAREVGINKSNGKYIGFVDADDQIKVSMYEELIHNAINYNADVSRCGMVYSYDRGEQEDHFGSNDLSVWNSKEGLIQLIKGQLVEPSLCCAIYSVRVIRDNTPDLTIANNEDLLRNFLIYKRANIIVNLDKCLYIYNIRSGSLSSKFGEKAIILNDIVKAREWIYRNIYDKDIEHEIKILLLNTYINCLKEAYHHPDEFTENDIIYWRNSMLAYNDVIKHINVKRKLFYYLEKNNPKMNKLLIRLSSRR